MSDRPEFPLTPTAPTRRSVLRAASLAALAGGGATVFGACAADGETTAPPASTGPTSSAPASSAPPSPSPAASSSPTPKKSATKKAAKAPSGPSVAAAKVPVGGGVILDDADYVITQPKKGSYKAFTKVCTHRQCKVMSVSDGTINCDCHGSKFDIADGSVANPPANSPLKEFKTTVFEDEVYIEA
jgi:nitrite reductase/ring-hydroxylating ferredoxin subunit